MRPKASVTVRTARSIWARSSTSIWTRSGAPAHRADGGLEVGPVGRVAQPERDVRSGMRERERDRPAQAPGGAGDQRDPTREREVRVALHHLLQSPAQRPRVALEPRVGGPSNQTLNVCA